MNHSEWDDDDLFPVLRAGDIQAEAVSENWLIEDLWSAGAVGWVAGQPKICKSWLALEMAVSVATATPCLDRFEVHQPGRVLVYLAEDSPPAVRERLEALAHQRSVPISALDVHVVTASSMRLDLKRDQVRLLKTARAHSPRLLILDPLVRLHRADENSSAEVSALLGYLRELQRELDLSIVVVHHARKQGGSGSQGQGLRGSGDLWAWSDSAMYLKRKGDDIALTLEHRSAPTPHPLTLRLVGDAGPPHLELVEGEPEGAGGSGGSLEERILASLTGGPPLSRAALRDRLSVRNLRLGEALERLSEEGLVERTPAGWRVAGRQDDDRSPFPPIGMDGNGTVDLQPEGEP